MDILIKYTGTVIFCFLFYLLFFLGGHVDYDLFVSNMFENKL